MSKQQTTNENIVKKMQNAQTSKDNEIRILSKDVIEYKRQIVQIMDVQSKGDKKLFDSLRVQTDELKQEIDKYRQQNETLKNSQIDYDELKKM